MYHRMVSYHWAFSSFPSFHNRIEGFLCHWKRKKKNYKCSLNLKSKGTKQKTHEEKKWYFVSNFASKPISYSFFIHFSQFQRLQMHYLKTYKTCLKWKDKKTIIEELKLQNHTKYLWKKPKHNPLHFEKTYLVYLSLDWKISYRFGCTKWRTTNCLKFQKQ
jgi:hypothetical protein